MSLPIHVGQIEFIGNGRVYVTETTVDYHRTSEMKGTITLQFHGDIFSGASPVSTPAEARLSTPLKTLMRPFTRKITA